VPGCKLVFIACQLCLVIFYEYMSYVRSHDVTLHEVSFCVNVLNSIYKVCHSFHIRLVVSSGIFVANLKQHFVWCFIYAQFRPTLVLQFIVERIYGVTCTWPIK